MDVFPTYEMSPDVSYYEPDTSPVTPALPVDSDYVSPGGPASMDSLLAGDSMLMDGDSDLLPLPLLPLPDDCILPPQPVAGSSPTDTNTHFDSVPANLSREGPFEVLLGASDVGKVPMVLNSLLGCPYRMTSYDRAEAYGLQLRIYHPRFLEYVGAPESARLLTRPPGHWVRTMESEEAVMAALQLQHDAD